MNAGGWNADYLPRETLERLSFKALGRDVLIHSTCVVRNCGLIALGDGVRIDPFTVISVAGGLEIGPFTHVAAHCLLTGAETIVIDAFAGLSHGVRIFSASADFTGGGIALPTVPEALRCDRASPVRLGGHALLGANCVVLPGAEVGAGAAFGAFALVKGRHEPWTLNAGAPATKIGMRDRHGVLDAERKFRAMAP